MTFHVLSIFVLHLLNYQSHVNCINLGKSFLGPDIIPFLPQSLIIQHQQTLCYFTPIDSIIRRPTYVHVNTPISVLSSAVYSGSPVEE
jgi:hypothetical protein